MSPSLIVHGRSQRGRPVNINTWNNQGEPPRRAEPPVPGGQRPEASGVLAERTLAGLGGSRLENPVLTEVTAFLTGLREEKGSVEQTRFPTVNSESPWF